MKEETKDKIKSLQDIICVILLGIWMFIPVLKEIKTTCVMAFKYEYTFIKFAGLIGLLFLIIDICIKLRNKEYKKEYEKEILPITVLGLFLIWTFISSLFSPNKELAFFGTEYRKDGYISYLAYGGFFSLAFLINSKALKKIVINLFLLTAMLNSIIVQCYNWNLFTNIIAPRDINRTCFFNINHYGYYLVLATTTANFLFVTQKNKLIKLIYLLCYIILLYYLILNDTLGCYLAVGTTLIIFFIYCLYNKKKKIISMFSIVLFIIVSLSIQSSSNIIIRNMKNLYKDMSRIIAIGNMQDMSEEEKEEMLMLAEQGGSGRIRIWKAGIKFFSQRPIMGYGPENLEIKYKELEIEQDRPHNLIIQQATTSGIIGVVTYFFAIGIILISGLKFLRIENSIHVIAIGSVFAYLISAMFGNSMYYTSPYFFIFLGLLMCENINEELVKRSKKMEYLDLYDKDGNLTGETIIRGGDVPKGRYFNIVVCYIKNSEGKFLIQKTSKEKGGKYSSTGGHVKSGQTLIEAMIAEIGEEIGIDIKEEELKYIDRYIKNDTVIFNLYYIEKDIDVKKCKLQKEEVESVSWMTINEIDKLIKEENYFPTHGILFEKIKKMG